MFHTAVGQGEVECAVVLRQPGFAMEQDSLYKQIPKPDTPLFDSIRNSPMGGPVQTRLRLPYGRCPSDEHDANAPLSNYVGSMGPQCLNSNCGYDPFEKYCDPKNSGLGDWGYIASVPYGDSATSKRRKIPSTLPMKSWL